MEEGSSLDGGLRDTPVDPEDAQDPGELGCDAGAHEESDEEDVWIAEEIERQERELREDQSLSGERYVPQLMDTLEMRALQSEFQRTEAQFENEGRMREYTPRRPATSVETAVHIPRRPRLSSASSTHSSLSSGGEGAHLSFQNAATSRENGLNSAGAEIRGGPSTSLSSPRSFVAPTQQKRAEMAQSLRLELHQARELELRYSEMKRVLLEHMDMICSSKLHDRVGSPETFEQLAELMAYADQCAATSLSIVQ